MYAPKTISCWCVVGPIQDSKPSKGLASIKIMVISAGKNDVQSHYFAVYIAVKKILFQRMKVILLNASKNCNLSKTSHNYHQLSKNNRKVLDLKDSEAAMGIMNSPPL